MLVDFTYILYGFGSIHYLFEADSSQCSFYRKRKKQQDHVSPDHLNEISFFFCMDSDSELETILDSFWNEGEGTSYDPSEVPVPSREGENNPQETNPPEAAPGPGAPPVLNLRLHKLLREPEN